MAEVFRRLTEADLPALLDLQEPAAVAGLAEVFPQDLHPFPREAVLARWRAELDDPTVAAYVATNEDGDLLGFAARRGEEVLHFGTAIDTWGSGLAAWLLDELLASFDEAGRPLRLWVFTDNRRGRRFYEKHGWVPTGRASRSTFPPYPELLEYELPKSRADESVTSDGSR